MKRVKEFSKNAYRISSSHKIHHCDNVVALEEKKKKTFENDCTYFVLFLRN